MQKKDGLNSLPRVAILLATYNGQYYLAEQLQSFETQTYSNWFVYASDDGSQDDTAVILDGFQDAWGAGRLSIQSGPSKGVVANFLSLTCNVDIQADYYAYSDQDDIWDADKLERAVHWLETVPTDMPAIYCGRTRLVDEENNEIGLSPLFPKQPSFANALMQNIGGGNTMVFNNAARKLLLQAGENVFVASHDWWAYMVVTGNGGRVFYDQEPSVRYRQHDDNVIGMNSSWLARYMRIRMLWRGQFCIWNDGHIAELRALSDKLTPENREILERFAQARDMGLAARLINLTRSGIYRQTLLGNLGLIAAAIFKKI